MIWYSSIWFDLIWYKFIYTNLTYIVIYIYLICADQVMFFSVEPYGIQRPWLESRIPHWIGHSDLENIQSFSRYIRYPPGKQHISQQTGSLGEKSSFSKVIFCMVGYVSSQEDWRYEPEKMPGNSVTVFFCTVSIRFELLKKGHIIEMCYCWWKKSSWDATNPVKNVTNYPPWN